MFVDVNHINYKVTGIFITGLFLMVGPTTKTWSPKHQTLVQTSKFGAEFTALNKVSDEESVMIQYHLISMGIKVSKPTPILL